MPSPLSNVLQRRMLRRVPFGGVRFTTVAFDNLTLGSELNDAVDGSKGWDGPWISRPFYAPGFLGLTDMKTLSSGASIADGTDRDGGAEGYLWDAAWVARSFYAPGFMGVESFNTLTIGASVDGQGAGIEWSGVCVARDFAFPLLLGSEDFSSYADASDLDGATGGTGWGGPWVR